MAKLGKGIKMALKIVGAFLVLFIGALIAIPYFYKDEILNQGKAFANEQINATLAFDNDKVGLSLLWTFPDFSFEIGDLSVTGHDEFEGKKLADIGKFYFTLNVMDVINGTYKINGIELSDADFYVKVLRNGKANYDIMKPSDAPVEEEETTTTTSSDMSLKIDHWAINNTNLIYDDEPGNMYVEVKNLNHRGSGDFSLSLVDLETETTMDGLTVSMDGVRYLKKAEIEIDFNANVDMDNSVYKIMDNSFRINALQLGVDGEVAMPNDDITMDLTFKAPNTAFSSVLSLVPAAYTKDFSNVKTKGVFNFSGFAKGTYNGDKGTLPAFGIDLGIKEGEFKYPDLPLPVEDINTQISVKSPSSDLDKMLVDVSKFHIKIGKNPFDAMLKLKTPMSDPNIDTKIDGTINLDELSKAFPMEGVSELSGIIKANLETHTKMSYVTNEQYDQVMMKGLLAISNMNYTATGLPPVKINNMAMDFTPNNVALNDFDLKIGKSDIRANGTLDNILTYFSRDKIMRGNLVVSSNVLDLNEISAAGGSREATTEEENTTTSDPSIATGMQDTTEAEDEGIFDRFEFAMDANFKNITYDVYEIKDLAAKGSFSPSVAVLEDFTMLLGKIDIHAKGNLDNVFGYVFNDETIKGSLTLYSKYMNLNQFMTDDGEAVEPEVTETPVDAEQVEKDLEPMQIPGNIDFALLTTFDELIYDTYHLKEVQAEVHVHNHILDINALRAKAFGGGMALNGHYNTQDPENPKFEFGYDVTKLDIQAIAKQVGVSDKLLPIMKSIYGQFNSEFKIQGKLDKNLSPDLASLTAKGVLETFNTVIKDNQALNTLSEKLKMDDLKTLDLQNTTNFFTLKDGRLNIDPATYKVKGMDMILGGSHGLDNTMDYDMKMRIPRDLLAKTAVGAVANNAISTGIGALAGQAEKLGIKIEDSKFVNVDVLIGGTMTKPEFKVKLLGAEGKGGETLGDQAMNKLKEEADRIKEEMAAKAKAEADRIRAEAEAQLKAEQERLKKEAEEKAKKLAQQAASNPGSVMDSIKNGGGILKDPGKLVDPNKLGNLLGGGKDKNGDKNDGKKKKNPFGKFKNPFGGG